MQKIPFTVSAKTARLIGRDNVASAKGAIVELVKNAYDADSDICCIVFDDLYSRPEECVSSNHYEEWLKLGVDEIILRDCYEKELDGDWKRKKLTKRLLSTLTKELQKLASLYLIDNGEGMTQKIITEEWMKIGTAYKEHNIRSAGGRVRNGAKGIGRFALDRLGDRTTMYTSYDKSALSMERYPDRRLDSNYGYLWEVDWSEFEGDGKPIHEVNATLDAFEQAEATSVLDKIIPNPEVREKIKSLNVTNGTILKISQLRDNWERKSLDSLFEDLEIIVPSEEEKPLLVSMYSLKDPEKYGEVEGAFVDDFDYKVTASVSENQTVRIEIDRNEQNLAEVRDFLNEIEETLPGYDRTYFKSVGYPNKRRIVELSLSDLLNNFEDVNDALRSIGAFDFTLYFLKKSTSGKNRDIFHYREFNSAKRKRFLEKRVGIKLYRDNFRVRPYGESASESFDWLNLGGRKSSSPAGVAKKDGGYRVSPDNVVGVVNISRLNNVGLVDKSSREGVHNTPELAIFKTILQEIIGVFEVDRSTVARGFKNIRDLEEDLIIDGVDVEELVNESIDSFEDKEASESSEFTDDQKKRYTLAKVVKKREEEIKELRSEQNILRAMASTGLTFAVFSHDVTSLHNKMHARSETLRFILNQHFKSDDMEGVDEWKNPYVFADELSLDDERMRYWLGYALNSSKKSKRERHVINLKTYIENLPQEWNEIVETRNIHINIEAKEKVSMESMEIDLDSIFNNLLINSIEAFRRLSDSRQLCISIRLIKSEDEVSILYQDNGPGLSSSIQDPQNIFKPMFTTKRDPDTGKEIGTGLGMWIIKSIVDEYNGLIKLPNLEGEGFNVLLTFNKDIF